MKFKFAALATTVVAALTLSTAAQAALATFSVTFAPEPGAIGNTGLAASGSGSAVVTFDDVSHVLSYKGDFTGLTGNATQAHFHCCTPLPNQGNAGIAVDSPSLVGFPVGAKSGVFDAFLDLDDVASFNANFLAASGGTTDLAIARFMAGVLNHTTYMNIHSSTLPGGEIRGFLVPEPSSLALLVVPMLALGATARRRKTT